MNENESIIRLEGVGFAYGDADKPALDDINLEIKRGEFAAVLGHNGSGKSTLAKLLNALLIPTAGKVFVNGLDSSDADNTWSIRQCAGMVFQNPDNQIIATIVEEDVAFGAENLGVPPDEIRRRVDGALESLGIGEFADKQPHHLSGGQKQRVAIAGILAMKPMCIILDEPTAMLDPIGRREVIKAVRKLNKEEGITIVLITHYMDEAVAADRVIVVDKGRIARDGTPAEVFAAVEFMKSAGLDVPQAAECAYELRKLGFDLPVCLDADSLINAMPEPTGTVAHRPSKPSDTEPQTETVLRADKLNHIYSQGDVFEKAAVKDVSLELRKGGFYALIGHTGSGKSTLIQHFNGLIKPTSGSIILDGIDIHHDKSKMRRVREKVGLVFQYPEHQLFEVTVEADVSFGPKNMGVSDTETKRRAGRALALVGLSEEDSQKSPFELSGGQKRRAAIAGVLAMEPELLILDEPTAGLDPRGRDEILGNIAKMHREWGITIVLVSHSMEDVAKFADKVFVMKDGALVMEGEPASVFARGPELEGMGLAAPQASSIIAGLNRRGYGLPEDIFTVSAAVAAISERLKGGRDDA